MHESSSHDRRFRLDVIQTLLGKTWLHECMAFALDTGGREDASKGILVISSHLDWSGHPNRAHDRAPGVGIALAAEHARCSVAYAMAPAFGNTT